MWDTNISIIFFFSRLYLFLRQGRKREREGNKHYMREKHQSAASLTHPNQWWNPQSRHVPDLSEQETFCSAGGSPTRQTTPVRAISTTFNKPRGQAKFQTLEGWQKHLKSYRWKLGLRRSQSCLLPRWGWSLMCKTLPRNNESTVLITVELKVEI